MPVSRQIRYLREIKDNWKEKAAEKQQKIRELEQKNSALSRSRQKWKTRAQEAEKRVKELEKEKIKSEKEHVDKQSEKLIENSLLVKGHHYTVQTIQISVQEIRDAGNSYRGVAKSLKILSQSLSVQSPHYSTIRQWLGRIGLYELKREKEKQTDWIFIIDLTVELGQEKAIVIYGISQKVWQDSVLAHGRGLRHTDGEILAIQVTKTATGEWINNILEKLSKQVGIPRQIVADNGSNLKKGIELYIENHPQVIHTYDVTHGMANLLKKELVPSKVFQKFITDCNKCRQQLQQTELAFLAPPSSRSKCRYFNVERLVNWAIKLLSCPLDILYKERTFVRD